MERAYTADQRNVAVALEELVKTPGRKILEEYVKGEIKTREDILLGKSKLAGINIDEIKFSEASVIRGHLEMLYKVVEYPNSYTKRLGIVKA